MRNFIVVGCVILLSSCGVVDRGVAQLTGTANVCVDGVQYLQFPSGVTVKYSPDGKIKTC